MDATYNQIAAYKANLAAWTYCDAVRLALLAGVSPETAAWAGAVAVGAIR